ncbi:hypothetical protein RHMOL_Rhmol05G0212200 [Rhododendron molle]|uniref:Uncharacterized protein n=1 Tax=Rhododendron molle TaxID=49168 RepID=A0ACC0NRC0_RHOML|nr:hypothetical protein RHMOL_Rhmol05G0212200 [Rhododendron molle]
MADAAIKAGELVVTQIIKESSRLSRVREDIAWIETEKGRIISQLKDAEGKESRTKGESNILNEARNLGFDMEDITDKYYTQFMRSMSRSTLMRRLDFRKMKFDHGFVKEVEDIKKRVQDFNNARQAFQNDESSSSREEDTLDPRQTFPHLDEPNVVGFDNQIETLSRKVLHEDLQHRVVSIIGAAGLGKTTLARKVYNLARHSKVHNSDQQHFARRVYNLAWHSNVHNSDQQRFDCAAWICVSQSPNEKGLFRAIGEQVGLEEKKIEHNVASNLFNFLRTKRYVIVIDDIWHTNAWDVLKIGLPTNSEKGSRIILTSRNRDVGVYVGGWDSVLELQALDQETSRRLFNNIIVDDPQDPPQLQTISEQILERCGGVPLAIVLAAGFLKLRERSVSAWRGVLEDMCQGNDQFTEIFALSYNDLPEKLRLCFLYFGLFPEDREIETFDLINLWAAEEFIRGSSERQVEEVGYDYLDCLIRKNLIQVAQRRFDGRVRSVRIHYILHKLCIRKAEEINFFYIHRDEINSNTALKARRVAIYASETDRYPVFYVKTSSLRAVFYFVRRYPWNTKGNKNLLRHSRIVRVFSVEDSTLPRPLLKKISKLRHLTYLKLESHAMTEELSNAISNLKSLLTLDLREVNYWHVNLPKVIWSMKQLRHILLPLTCYAPSFCELNLDVFHPVEITLPNLRTFSGLRGDLFNADLLRMLTNLRTLKVSSLNENIMVVLSNAAPVSQKLEELSLQAFPDILEANCLNLSRYDNLCELRIGKVKMNELSHYKLPPNLIELTLVETHLTTDPTEALKKLQKLKFLKLGHDSYLGKELVCSGEPDNFPQLEVLEIKELPNLEMVEVEEGGMPSLKDLRILRCSRETQIRIPDRVRNVMTI